MEEAKITNSFVLDYFDPDLFEPTSGMNEDRFLDMFLCLICRGVVIKPVECSRLSCATLYCKKCVLALTKGMQCPN